MHFLISRPVFPVHPQQVFNLTGGLGLALRHAGSGLQEQRRQHHEVVVCKGSL